MFGQVKGQEEQRRVEHFFDQHGREYVANVEISTGHPCEVLRALFHAPIGPDWFEGKLTPPSKYVRLLTPQERRGKPHNVEVDYVAWLQDLDVRQKEFDQKLHDFVRGAAKGGANIAELAKDPPPVIRELIGAKPFPPVVLVQACAASNPWAIGESLSVPKKAMALLEELKPSVTQRARTFVTGIDPLADDEDETGDLMGDLVAAVADPFADDLLDLEEQFDPKATGGTRVPVKTRGKRRTQTED